jgi:hypothetical protein
MTIRTPLAAALAAAALAAAPASAQVVYHLPACQPVVYHSPVVYHTPVVYHLPAYTWGNPVVYDHSFAWGNQAVFQSGRWYNSGSVVGQSVGLARLWDPDAGWGGFPFNARPGLNIAYRLLTR